MMRYILKSIYHFYLTARDFVVCSIFLGDYKKSWRFWGVPILSKYKNSEINIGVNFVACSLAKYNAIGVNQRVILKTTKTGSKIIIGDNVGISGCTISSSLCVSIGSNVFVGSGVLITDSDAHSIHPDLRQDRKFVVSKSITIEDNVFIGARSIVLKGVTIGEGSVIGAGSVVVKSIPRMSIAAGNPAKVVGKILNLEVYRDIF